VTLDEILAARPAPGQPRPYQFPPFERATLPSGLQVLTVHVPGRPLISVNMVVRQGAFDEPAEVAGATILVARAMTEGTERYPGVELTEAAERLGATLHVDGSWDAFTAGLDVAAVRFETALELLFELLEHPTFPEAEVARLCEERLNDLLQAQAEPRRRVDRAFSRAIYTADSPYSRPLGGDEVTVPRLSRDAVATLHRSLMSPDRAALVVGGDLSGLDVPRLVEQAFVEFGTGAARPEAALTPSAASAVEWPIVRLHHRAGSVQSEVRIGHIGLPRLIPDFHAVQIMGAILGGLFNSRLQLNLREDKGYTYGVGAGFDMRRAAGPFSVRTAVHTEATVPAISEVLVELRRLRDERVTEAELAAARDYLVGVFPLRFETPGAVVGSIGGLFAQGLPDDELARYRSQIEAVTVEDVRRAAQEHIDLDHIAIVLVGDADVVKEDLMAAGLGQLAVIREEAVMPRRAAGDTAREAVE
jgi:zinc protease